VVAGNEDGLWKWKGMKEMRPLDHTCISIGIYMAMGKEQTQITLTTTRSAPVE